MSDAIIQALIVAGVTAIATALVTAVATALATGYVSGKVMEVKINGLRESFAKLEKEIEKIRTTLHGWSAHIGWVDQQRRLGGKDGE